MGSLAKTYSFTAGTSIVANEVNENFDDVVDWATGTPSLSATGQTTTVNGRLDVTEQIWSADDIYLNGTDQRVIWEGSTADAYETFLGATNPTSADRTITLPDASGTVSLVDNASGIISNSVFN